MDLERAKKLQRITTILEYMQLAQKELKGPDIGIGLWVSGRIIDSPTIDEKYYYDLKKVLDDTIERYKKMVEEF